MLGSLIKIKEETRLLFLQVECDLCRKYFGANGEAESNTAKQKPHNEGLKVEYIREQRDQ